MASDWGPLGSPRLAPSARPGSAAESFWSEPAAPAPDAFDAEDFFGLNRKRFKASQLLARVAEEEREAAASRRTVS